MKKTFAEFITEKKDKVDNDDIFKDVDCNCDPKELSEEEQEYCAKKKLVKFIFTSHKVTEMKLDDVLTEGAGDTKAIIRLLSSGKVEIPRNSETQMPAPASPEAWKEFFEGEDDYGVDLDAVDWDLIHQEFYV